MDNQNLSQAKEAIGLLTDAEQDHLASYLLMKRLKRNKLVIHAIHQRIEDADMDNWETAQKTRDSLSE